MNTGTGQSARQRVYRLRLGIPSAEMEKLYRGSASTVSATTVCGKNIRFPANHLRQFLQKEGVYGLFEIVTSDEHRLRSIRRLA